MDELGFGKQVNRFKKKKLKMDYVLRQNLVFRLFLEKKKICEKYARQTI